MQSLVYSATFQPDIESVGGSLTASALIAALPLATLFVMLGWLRITAWISGLVSLLVALLVAVVGFGMPFDQAVGVSVWGAAFGFFPIMWIVINAIWVYNMTVETGHFDVLRRSFAAVSDDMRVQAIIIAFCFGALMEALAGFGTPVATWLQRDHRLQQWKRVANFAAPGYPWARRWATPP